MKLAAAVAAASAGARAPSSSSPRPSPSRARPLSSTLLPASKARWPTAIIVYRCQRWAESPPWTRERRRSSGPRHWRYQVWLKYDTQSTKVSNAIILFYNSSTIRLDIDRVYLFLLGVKTKRIYLTIYDKGTTLIEVVHLRVSGESIVSCYWYSRKTKRLRFKEIVLTTRHKWGGTCYESSAYDLFYDQVLPSIFGIWHCFQRIVLMYF